MFNKLLPSAIIKHMKRTNLVLNEEILEKATLLLGAKTYSDAVNQALEQTIKLHYIRELVSIMGTGVWDGDLSEMREDKVGKKKKSRTRKR